MKCQFLLLCVLSPGWCNAQLLRSSLPVSYATAGTYSKNFTDVFSFTKNQASLSATKNITAGIYSEKRFMLQDLKAFSAAISFPCIQGGGGFSADLIGFKGYNQSHIGMAYGRSLGSKVDLGIQFNYNRLSLSGYGSSSATNFEVGTIIRLTEKLYTGCHVYNPVGGKFGVMSKEKLASVYSLGLGYEASDKLFIGSEIIKEENQQVDFHVALHYAFEKQFFVRGGISSSIGNYFVGAGISWKTIRFDIAADRHPQAGLTPSLLLIFILSKSKTALQE